LLGIRVLLGAGASFDCPDSPLATIQGNYRPPLVNDLFRPNPRFEEFLNKYPGARGRADEIRGRLNQGKRLEELLRQMGAVSR